MSTGAYQASVNGKKVYCVPYFHVGYVMITINNVNPSTYYGGTWVRIAQGKTLIGVNEDDSDFSTVEKTGGSKTNKLYLKNMPKYARFIASAWGYGATSDRESEERKGTDSRVTLVDSAAIFHSGTSFERGWMNFGGNEYYPNTYFGDGEAVNNLQPYLTVYFWQKTSD